LSLIKANGLNIIVNYWVTFSFSLDIPKLERMYYAERKITIYQPFRQTGSQKVVTSPGN
jgi:hypothetical protein